MELSQAHMIVIVLSMVLALAAYDVIDLLRNRPEA